MNGKGSQALKKNQEAKDPHNDEIDTNPGTLVFVMFLLDFMSKVLGRASTILKYGIYWIC